MEVDLSQASLSVNPFWLLLFFTLFQGRREHSWLPSQYNYSYQWHWKVDSTFILVIFINFTFKPIPTPSIEELRVHLNSTGNVTINFNVSKNCRFHTNISCFLYSFTCQPLPTLIHWGIRIALKWYQEITICFSTLIIYRLDTNTGRFQLLLHIIPSHTHT